MSALHAAAYGFMVGISIGLLLAVFILNRADQVAAKKAGAP